MSDRNIEADLPERNLLFGCFVTPCLRSEWLLSVKQCVEMFRNTSDVPSKGVESRGGAVV